MNRSILLVLLSCSVALSQTNQPTPHNPDRAGRELRMLMLTTSAKKANIQPTKEFPEVYGVLMDWPFGDQTVTVASRCDGTASIYSTSAFGVVGGAGHEAVRNAARRFVTVAERHYDAAASTKDYPYPAPGRVRFYLVCFDGVRVIETDEAMLKAGKDICWDMWTEAQRVMTELRLVAQEQRGKQSNKQGRGPGP